jgi:hypothetical protein
MSAEDGPARPQNHRAVSLDQGRKRSLIARGEKPFEELAVRQGRQASLDEEMLDLPQGRAHPSRRHV